MKTYKKKVMEDKKKKIEEFIKENGIDFNAYGSEFNSHAVELAGFACSINVTLAELREIIKPYASDIRNRAELVRVYKYAKVNSYGDFWHEEIKKED